MTQECRVQPVSDLHHPSRVRADAEAAAASDALADEHPQQDGTAALPLALALSDEHPSPLDRNVFLFDPCHPRPQVRRALGDDGVQRLRVADHPPPQHQPVLFQPLREHQPTIMTASETALTLVLVAASRQPRTARGDRARRRPACQ
jgi:hypothetical protein